MSVDLNTLTSVTSRIPGGLTAATAFDLDLAVDATGNPHMLVNVSSGDGTSYAIQPYAVNMMYDVYYDGSAWQAEHLADLETFRNTFGLSPISHDNRPQISISDDGYVLACSWADSDSSATGSENNQLPAQN